MHRHYRNANFYSFLFNRYQHSILSVLWWIISLLLISHLQISHATDVHVKKVDENPDRTIAKLGPREIQLTTTQSPLPISVPALTSTVSTFDRFIHTLYVISLDGKITAIDAHDHGHQLWTIDTGAPLIDSSLSKIEISRDSRSIRLIPSLIGGLYERYDDDGRVEPLPFDADELLDASFKLHEELAITGGKQIDTLGIDLQTGQILYSFSKDDPKQKTTLENNQTTTENLDTRDVLVVKRITKTVRARSARGGHEKWNFSVSNHDLLYLHAQPASIVLGQVEDSTTFKGIFEYKLQTGSIIAFDERGNFAWFTQTNAPIAAVWELKNGQLTEKSLFETPANHFSHDDSNDDDEDSSPPTSPRIAFVGEFNSTPYVIVTPHVQKKLIYYAKKNNIAGIVGHKRPVLSFLQKQNQKRTSLIGSEVPDNNNNDERHIGWSTSERHSYPLALRSDPTGSPASSSSSTSMDNTCDRIGYFKLISNVNDYLTDDYDKRDSTIRLETHTNIYIPTNALVILTLFLGLTVFLLIWLFKPTQFGYKRQESMLTDSSANTVETASTSTECEPLDRTPSPSFQSRYTLEYEHVRFLGRGGFGVVFEAINKLDERRVAIKRVSLKKISGKERALKEIRFLAVLNHPNLIQYFYAWNESPPVGWQEEEDKTILAKNSMNPRDSLSTLPLSGNETESAIQTKSSKLPAPLLLSSSAKLPKTNSPSSLFEITFDRSSNPLHVNEDFSNSSINNNNDNNKSDISSSSLSSANHQAGRLDANNNTKPTAKRSLSSSSPMFDYSSDSSTSSSSSSSLNESNQKTPAKKDVTETDDGIIFVAEEEQPPLNSTVPSIQTQTKSLVLDKKKPSPNDKDIPTTYFYFVMELCQPESLRDRLIQRTIDRHEAWSIFDQIIRGIEYIHSKKLIHRDLKPSNILFSMDNTVKIGDFGLVSAFGDEKIAKKKKRDDDNIDQIEHNERMSITSDACGNNEHGGTMLYMSPEQMNRQPYNQKVDIYAMGIILFELLYPFSTQMERLHAITKVRLPTPVFPSDFPDGTTSGYNQLVCRLIRWLLSYSSHERPRANELRNDSFYQRVLQIEVPELVNLDKRQQNPTMVSQQEQTAGCLPQQNTARISSSTLLGADSSSALQSLRDSGSEDTGSLS